MCVFTGKAQSEEPHTTCADDGECLLRPTTSSEDHAHTTSSNHEDCKIPQTALKDIQDECQKQKNRKLALENDLSVMKQELQRDMNSLRDESLSIPCRKAFMEKVLKFDGSEIPSSLRCVADRCVRVAAALQSSASLDHQVITSGIRLAVPDKVT